MVGPVEEEVKTEEEVLSDEIGDLVDAPVVEEVPPVETPPEDTPPAEVPPEEIPPEEIPPEVPPEEETPPAEPSVEDVPPSEPPAEEPTVEVGAWTPPTRKEYDDLLITMNDMAGKVALGRPVQPPVAAPAEEKPPETPKPVVPEIKPIEPIEFVATEDELYEISRDPKKFNELMNKVAMETHNRAVQLTTQNVLMSIPRLVGKSIEQATTIQRAADEFYQANEDLVPFKRFVMMVTNDMAAANPDKTIPELLDDIAVESRKKLNLKAKAVESVKKKEEVKPAFVKPAGPRRTPAPKPEGMQAEIDDLITI